MLKIILLLTAAAIIAVLAGCSTETGPDAGADAGPVADAGDTFPPDRQTPLFEKGLVIPRNFLPCKAEDGSETYNCNHHGSTIAMLRDGTMAITWYHGLGEKSRDTRILWSRLYPGAKEWSPAEVLFDDPLRAEGNPAIWVDEKGVVWVFFVVIYGRDAWDDAEIMYVKSPDNGASWTAPVTLREEFGWMTRQRPLRLANGGILLPCYNERLALPTFIRSMDNFATWEEMPSDSAEYVVNHVGNIQPSIILRNDGSVLALTRNGMPDRRVGSMSSVSNGRSWTPNVFTALPNSGTSIDQFKLRDGHVVVIFNNDQYERFPLTAALSVDDGKTFTTAVRDINGECDGGGCSYAYPSVVQNTRDGTIWASYTHNRETIGWVHFNEAWLKQGGGTLK